MHKGILYGVSVGPGDPGLLTLKAVNTISACPVIATPRTNGKAMIALEIVKKAIDLNGKEIVPLDFTMSHNQEQRSDAHKAAAEKIKPFLDIGKSVAMLNLGDVSIYASYQYIADVLGNEGYTTAMIAGVPSFCAAAAELNISLTEIDKTIHIIPSGCREYSELSELGGTKIWMKSGHGLPKLLEQMEAKNRLDKAVMVQNCGMENQRVFHTLKGVKPESDYFSLIIERE